MTTPLPGGIDCDLHPAVPHLTSLLPYMNDYWRDQVTTRGMTDLVSQSYPTNSPISSRPDWRPGQGKPGSDLADMQKQALDRFGTAFGICNPLYGVQMVFSEDMQDAFCRALNDWLVKEWLDKEPRLRASILVPLHNPDLAVKEIERLAPDTRFVQVLVPVMGEAPLGRRLYWPIYEAAEKHGLAIGMHAGSTYRHAPTAGGWPSYQVEDYVLQSGNFENQLISFIAEGVFQQFPKLKLVCIESGVTWLPTLLWRVNKTWRGVRPEVPWVDRPPADIIRDHVRFTLQPIDAPPGDAHMLTRTLEHMGSDRLLLFSTDFPHWHFEGDKVLPDGLPDAILRKMLVENALDTYPRLREDAGTRPSQGERVVP
jgi:predicted TIM-barrel fold metal-dependent hydrolase